MQIDCCLDRQWTQKIYATATYKVAVKKTDTTFSFQEFHSIIRHVPILPSR